MQCFFRDLSFNLSPHTITCWLPTVCMVKDMLWHLSPSSTGKSDYDIIKTDGHVDTGLWKTVKDVLACLSPHNVLNDNGLQCMVKDWKMNWNKIWLCLYCQMPSFTVRKMAFWVSVNHLLRCIWPSFEWHFYAFYKAGSHVMNASLEPHHQ